MHVHLVAHSRKARDESQAPGKMDVKGSGSITDQPDNIWLIWRNKAKEEAAKQSGFNSKKREEPDQLLMCRKQRNFDGSGEGEPTIKLWFNRDAGQFVADAGAGPMQFKSFPHRSGAPESSHVDY